MKNQPDSFCYNPKCAQNQIRDIGANKRREIEIISGMLGANRRKVRRVQYGNIKTKEYIYFCEICHSAIEIVRHYDEEEVDTNL